jgi:hypothetical protein
MTFLKTAIREVFGLFVDDEFLAAATLAVIGVTAIAVDGAGVDTLVGAALLLGGCLIVLAAGVWRTARSRPHG